MTVGAVVDLRDRHTWNPAEVALDAFAWPTRVPVVQLREVAESLNTDATVSRGTPTISPSGLDPLFGGVLRRTHEYQGAAYMVHSDRQSDGLAAGDVLVPASSEAHVLLVTPDLVGSVVGPTFQAFRVLLGDPLWLWGVLNSTAGKRMRELLSGIRSIEGHTRDQMLQARIPWPPLAMQHDLAPAISNVLNSTLGREEAAVETWWRTIDLTTVDWRSALAAPDPSALRDGEPLASLCTGIRRGNVRRADMLESPQSGSVPVSDIALLAGKEARRWCMATERMVVAAEGDVLVAAVGERNYASLARGATAVDRNVYALRPRDATHAPALVRYLNGPAGHARRRFLLSGTTVRSLRSAELAQLPVPADDLQQPVDVDALAPLHERLQDLLWI